MSTKITVPDVVAATDADWDTEYSDLVLSVKVVADLEEALEHIARHGSRHTEAICTDRKSTRLNSSHRT
mgnify:CR=1 FL=1